MSMVSNKFYEPFAISSHLVNPIVLAEQWKRALNFGSGTFVVSINEGKLLQWAENLWGVHWM
jgi:hypothetical protein